MGLSISNVQEVRDGDCISCGECVEVCPVKGALNFSVRGFVLKPLTLGVIGLVLFLGAYGTARYAGLWRTYSGVSKEALSNPVDGIFGWMTLEQAARQVSLPMDEFVRAAGLSADVPKDVPIKRIEGVDDEKLKEALRGYLASKPARPAASWDPEAIRGTHTLTDVASKYGVDIREVLKRAGWPGDLASSSNVPLKDLAARVGGEVSQIREAVKAILEERR
jgi:ferredoxin